MAMACLIAAHVLSVATLFSVPSHIMNDYSGLGGSFIAWSGISIYFGGLWLVGVMLLGSVPDRGPFDMVARNMVLVVLMGIYIACSYYLGLLDDQRYLQGCTLSVKHLRYPTAETADEYSSQLDSHVCGHQSRLVGGP